MRVAHVPPKNRTPSGVLFFGWKKFKRDLNWGAVGGLKAWIISHSRRPDAIVYLKHISWPLNAFTKTLSIIRAGRKISQRKRTVTDIYPIKASSFSGGYHKTVLFYVLWTPRLSLFLLPKNSILVIVTQQKNLDRILSVKVLFFLGIKEGFEWLFENNSELPRNRVTRFFFR